MQKDQEPNFSGFARSLVEFNEDQFRGNEQWAEKREQEEAGRAVSCMDLEVNRGFRAERCHRRTVMRINSQSCSAGKRIKNDSFVWFLR
jgi:hypothetical protein